MATYYKLARPDGFDFYSGKTINYRENIGKTVLCPPSDWPNRIREGVWRLCTTDVLHASDTAEKCFVGAKVPCSLYRVEGTPVVEHYEKAGFAELYVLEELDPAEHFKWRYQEAVSPMHPLKIRPSDITESQISLVRAWASVWNSVTDSVRASVWASVTDSGRDSVWDSVYASVRDSVWASVRDSVWDKVRDKVRDSVWDSVRASVRASVWAYTGHIFVPVVDTWKYVTPFEGQYPFQPAVNLWMQGLVPSFDGKRWRLHGHEDARILWQGQIT